MARITRTCTIEGCERKHNAHGLCQAHYKAKKRNAPDTRTLASEEWRPVPDYEGLYEVSNHGRIRSVERETDRHNSRVGAFKALKRGRVLKPSITTKGYPKVMLSRDGEATGKQVHALVAAAFLGPRPGGLEINHKDHRRDNNHVSNLEYVTRSENMIHGRDRSRWTAVRDYGSPLKPQSPRPPEWFWGLFKGGEAQR